MNASAPLTDIGRVQATDISTTHDGDFDEIVLKTEPNDFSSGIGKLTTALEALS